MTEFEGVTPALGQALSRRGHVELASVQKAILAPELKDADLPVSVPTGATVASCVGGMDMRAERQALQREKGARASWPARRAERVRHGQERPADREKGPEDDWGVIRGIRRGVRMPTGFARRRFAGRQGPWRGANSHCVGSRKT